MILYYHIICDLLASGFRQFHLGLGNDLGYKRHFCAVRTETYNYKIRKEYFYPQKLMLFMSKTPRFVRNIYRMMLLHRIDKTLLDMLAAKNGY
jgi:hypothetical protein